MPATSEDVNRLARAMCREVPVTKLADLLKQYQAAASHSNGGGGCACGAGCTCNNAPDPTFDEYGHTELPASILNEIGTTKMDELRAAMAAIGASATNSIKS